MENHSTLSKRRKSTMWTYFEKKEESEYQVICKICKREYKNSNNTSNMKDHLLRKHPEVLVSKLSSEKENCEVENRDCQQHHRTAKYSENSSRKKMLDNLFVKMIAIDMEPFRLSEREGLKEFVAALDPRYEMPRRSTATSKLSKLYMKMKFQMMTILEDTRYMAITADVWTSNSNQGILALTSHFIKEKKLISALLASKVIEGHHNADNISSVIASILEEWNCRHKVVTIVTDSASVMIKVADNLKIRHVPCFAHNLNLIIKDALHNCMNLKAIVEKCKAIVTFHRHSTLASDKLKMCQRELNKQELKLVQYVETRWNSALYMISRIREVRDELTLALNQNPNAPPNLTAQEYSFLEEVEKIFETIESAIETISGEEYVTLSLIIPLIKGMSLRFAELEPMLDLARPVLENIKTSIASRLKPYENRSACIISTLLNPHFKKKGFKTDTDAERAVQYVLKEYSSYLLLSNKTSSSAHETERHNEKSKLESSSEDILMPSKKTKPNNLLSFLETPKNSNSTADAIVDVRQYVEKPIIPRSEYPIEYWSYSQNNLKYIALKYMCIPGTSTPAERIFSKAGQIVNDRRNRLSGEHINELLFINQNNKIFKN